MYFAYRESSTYGEKYNCLAEDQIGFIKKIVFGDGNELALVHNGGSLSSGGGGIDGYDSDSDNYIYLNGEEYSFVPYGFNILLVSKDGFSCVWNEGEFREIEGLSSNMLEFFQQLYKTMSLGTSVSC